MAGFYPDVPAPRMAYDRDGTQLIQIVINSSTVYETPNSELVKMNDEDSDYCDNYSWYGNVGGVTYGLVFVFPQLRDISGYMVEANTTGSSLAALQTSVDTTNGLDGTWSTVDSAWNNAYGSVNKEAMRNSITATPMDGIKALRFLTNMGTGGSRAIRFYCVHLYGQISTGQTPDRLRLWHPTIDQPLDAAADGAYLDWGDVTQGTSADRSFRIKNNSSTMTANSIAVTAEAPTDATPSIPPQMTFSDGGAFSTSINIGNLVPGAISPVITMRRVTPSNAALSLWAGRVNIVAGNWS